MASGGLFQRAVVSAENDKLRIARFCVLLHKCTGFFLLLVQCCILVVVALCLSDVQLSVCLFDVINIR